MPNPFTGRGSIRRFLVDLVGACFVAWIVPAVFIAAEFFN